MWKRDLECIGDPEVHLCVGGTWTWRPRHPQRRLVTWGTCACTCKYTCTWRERRMVSWGTNAIVTIAASYSMKLKATQPRHAMRTRTLKCDAEKHKRAKICRRCSENGTEKEEAMKIIRRLMMKQDKVNSADSAFILLII